MSHCMEAFDDWANKKYPPVDLHEIHRDIVLQYEIFRKIQDNIECSRKYIMDLERDLDKDTEQLLGSTSPNDQLLLLKMGTLCIDGNLQSTMSLSASTSISLTNGDCYANGDNGVTRLIEENNML